MPSGSAAPASPATLTAKLLADHAAAAALSGPDVGPGQWVYRKVRMYTAAPPKGAPATITEAQWETADGTKMAMPQAGMTGTGHPVVTYSQLSSLPSDPAALVKYLQALDKPGPNASAAEFRVAAFGDITEMLTTQVLPPKLTAELYQALADIPTVQVKNHVTDIAGRAGVAFVLPETPQSATWELILDPKDYHLMAQASWGDDSTPPNSPVAFNEEAILQTAFVSRPGVYPPGSVIPSSSSGIAVGQPGTSVSLSPRPSSTH
jgi:hypothetical protein